MEITLEVGIWAKSQQDSQVECLEMALNVHSLCFVLNSSRGTDDCIDCANGKVGDIKIVSMGEVWPSMWQESRDGFVVAELCQHCYIPYIANYIADIAARVR